MNYSKLKAAFAFVTCSFMVCVAGAEPNTEVKTFEKFETQKFVMLPSFELSLGSKKLIESNCGKGFEKQDMRNRSAIYSAKNAFCKSILNVSIQKNLAVGEVIDSCIGVESMSKGDFIYSDKSKFCTGYRNLAMAEYSRFMEDLLKPKEQIYGEYVTTKQSFSKWYSKELTAEMLDKFMNPEEVARRMKEFHEFVQKNQK